MQTKALDLFDASIDYNATAWDWSSDSNPPIPILSEGALNNYLGYGTFGSKGSGGVALIGSAGALRANVDYRLNDYLDGSPSVYNIYDTNAAGAAFTESRYFRVTDSNGNNVKIQLGLRPVAKDLTLAASQLISPPANQFYVDVQRGKFLFPRPIFWSSLSSASAWVYPAIQYGASMPTTILTGSSFPWGGTALFDFQPGKFGYAFRHYHDGWGSSYSTLKPFTLSQNLGNGTMTFWFWMNQGAWSASMLYVYFNASTYIGMVCDYNLILDRRRHIYNINGAGEGSIASDTDFRSAWHHLAITWTADSDTGASKTITVYLDGAPIVGISGVSFNVNDLQIRTLQSHPLLQTAAVIYVYNVKVWNHVLSSPAAEYSTNDENFLHPTFVNLLNPKVGYYKRGILETQAWQLRPPTVAPNAQVQLEVARDFQYAEGYIGFKEVLKDAAYSPLISGTHYQYDKRVDASTTEDPNNGFDRTDEVDKSGGIYDTAASGALSTSPNNKFFRIVDNAKNVRFSGTGGLGLAIYAKDLSTTDITPPKTQCYVDPARGRFVLPRPNYFCKCDSIDEFANPTLRDEETPFVTGISTDNFSLVAGKTEFGGYGIQTLGAFTNVGYVYPFGYSNQQSFIAQSGTNATTIVFSSEQTFLPDEIVTVMVGNTTAVRGITSFTAGGTGTSFVVENLDELAAGDVIVVGNKLSQGTMSFWIQIKQAINSTAAFIIYLGGTNSFIYLDETKMDIYINSLPVIERMTLPTPLGTTYHHVYVMWDQAGSLHANTERIRLWIDGSEVTWTATIPVWAAGDFAFKFHVINDSVTIDNIKIFKHLVIESPDWEWGTEGAGRELAMHSMYGADHDYAPDYLTVDSGVGYYKSAGLTDIAVWTV